MCGGVHVSVRRRGTPALLPHRESTLDGARAPSHPAATQRRRNERRRGSDREACSARRPLSLRPPPPRRGGLAVAPRDGTARRGAAPGAAPGSDAEPSPKRHLQGVPHTVRRATRERGPHGGPRAGVLVPHAEAASEPPHAAECRLPHTSGSGTPPPQRAPPPPSRPGQGVAQLACFLQRRCRARPHAPLLQRAAYRLRRRGEGSANQAKGWASAEQKRPSNPPGPRLPNPYVVCRVYAYAVEACVHMHMHMHVHMHMRMHMHMHMHVHVHMHICAHLQPGGAAKRPRAHDRGAVHPPAAPGAQHGAAIAAKPCEAAPLHVARARSSVTRPGEQVVGHLVWARAGARAALLITP